MHGMINISLRIKDNNMSSTVVVVFDKITRIINNTRKLTTSPYVPAEVLHSLSF